MKPIPGINGHHWERYVTEFCPGCGKETGRLASVRDHLGRAIYWFVQCRSQRCKVEIGAKRKRVALALWRTVRTW